MQITPHSWPDSTEVEVIPEFQLILEDSAWPPADGDHASGVAAAIEFTISRDLTGGSLPGSARGGSGFSVASGNVTIAQPAGVPLTPWAAQSRRVDPGGLAAFQAAHAIDPMILGRFIVERISGADSAGTVDVGLTEQQQNLDGACTYSWKYDSAESRVDAVAVMAACATGGGYVTSWYPRRAASTAVRAPLDGSIQPASEMLSLGGATVTNWLSVGGQTLMGPDSVVNYLGSEEDPWAIRSTVGLFLCATVSGAGCSLTLSDAGGVAVGFKVSMTSVEVSTRGGVDTVQLNSASGPSRPVCIYWQTATQIVISDPSTGFAVTKNLTTPTTGRLAVTRIRLWTGSTGSVRDVLVGRDKTPPSASQPTAFLEPTGSLISGVPDTGGKSNREVMQDIARATLGAVWQSETGALIHRNRDSLRTGQAVEVVLADEQLEDVQWDIDREESADRVELSFTPSATEYDNLQRLTLWEMTEKTHINPLSTSRYIVDLAGATDSLAQFLPIWDDTTAGADGTRRSRWAASTSAEGGGDRPGPTDVRVEAVLLSSTQARISVTNNTQSRVWMVDGNGDPCLILRTSRKVTVGEPQTIAQGQPANKAVTPLQLDAGGWVQEATTAQEQLDWVAGQMSGAQAVLNSVNVRPNLARQLGDIIIVTEEKLSPTHVPIRAKAIITGTNLSGGPNGYDQNLSLALLAITFSDAHDWLSDYSVKTFEELENVLTASNIRTFGDFETWATQTLVVP